MPPAARKQLVQKSKCSDEKRQQISSIKPRSRSNSHNRQLEGRREKLSFPKRAPPVWGGWLPVWGRRKLKYQARRFGTSRVNGWMARKPTDVFLALTFVLSLAENGRLDIRIVSHCHSRYPSPLNVHRITSEAACSSKMSCRIVPNNSRSRLNFPQYGCRSGLKPQQHRSVSGIKTRLAP